MSKSATSKREAEAYLCLPGDKGRFGGTLEALVGDGVLKLSGVQLTVPVEVHEAKDALAHDLALADAAQQLPVPTPVQFTVLGINTRMRLRDSTVRCNATWGAQ